jgi:hypothetical protein
MPVTPSGHLSLPLSYLRNTIAASASFQSWTGTVDATAAAARVKIVEYPEASVEDPSAIVLPIAVIDWAGVYERVMDAAGTRNWFDARGALSIMFRSKITDTDPGDAAFTHLNNVGAIWADLENLAGTATASTSYLDITAIRKVRGPERPTLKEVTALGYDFYQTFLEVEFRAT